MNHSRRNALRTFSVALATFSFLGPRAQAEPYTPPSLRDIDEFLNAVSKDRVEVVSHMLRANPELAAAVDRLGRSADVLARLAERHGPRALQALRRTVAALPWSGVVHGALGVEKVVAQIGSGGGVVVWDPDREGH